MQTVVVPLDGSILARQALPYARALTPPGRPLHLLRAVPGHGDPSAEAREAHEHLAAVGAALELQGRPSVPHVVLARSAADAISETVATLPGPLVVMTTHGRTGLGRVVYGSVAERVLRQCRAPVLLVPAAVRRAWPGGPGGRIVVPMDGSPFSEEVLPAAAEMAAALGAEVVLLRAIEDPYQAAVDTVVVMEPFDPRAEIERAERYLDVKAEALKQDGIVVSVKATVAEPATAIAQMAAEPATRAVALATHARGGVGRLFLGSVTAAVLRHTSVPVLVLRPVKESAEGAEPEPFRCHLCGAAHRGDPVSVGVDARCAGCYAHLHVCGNCVYDHEGRCMAGRGREGDPPGLGCHAFGFRFREAKK